MHKIKEIFIATFLLTIVESAPAFSMQTVVDDPEAHAAYIAALESSTNRLLEKITRQRYEELENTRKEVRGDLDAWMSGDMDFDGKKVQRMLADALRIAEGYGLDVERMERVQKVARAAILRSDFSGQGETGIGTLKEFTDKVKDAPVVGNVVAYYNLIDDAEVRAANAMRKKVVQYKNLLQVYIKALTIEDPSEALSHMQNYTRLAVEYVTAQERQAIDADIKSMLAAQNGVVEFVGVVPLVGDAMDVLSLVEGEDLAGNKFTAMDATIQGILTAAPTVIGQAIKRRARIGAVLGSFLFGIKNQTANKVAQINARLVDTVGPGALQSAVQKIEQLIPAKLRAKGKVLYARQQEARRQLKTWGNETVRNAAFSKGRAVGAQRVDAFKKALASGNHDAIRAAMLNVQSDKHAMQMMKLENAGADAINAFNAEIGQLYKKTDGFAKEHLANAYLESYLKKIGKTRGELSKNDLKKLKTKLKKNINILLITNPGTGKVKVSFDRDVTARIKIDGEWQDIPAPVLDEAYSPAFYRSVHGTLPTDKETAMDLMLEMDQVATDALHNEAYFNLGVALDPTMESVFNDPEQIGQVVAFKANHWFEKAGKLVKQATDSSANTSARLLATAEGDLEEGFRQLKKQYDKQITARQDGLKRVFENQKNELLDQLEVTTDTQARTELIQKLAAYRTQPKGLNDVPDDLQAGYGIIANIGGAETPASAMKKLAAMGMTPQDFAKRVGDQVTYIHKGFPYQEVEKQKQVGLLRYPDGWLKKRNAQ